jgi:hypothetical protein
MSNILAMLPPPGDTSIPTISRRARLEDFFGDDACTQNKNYYNENQCHNDSISKNQQEFGHKKRIKP